MWILKLGHLKLDHSWLGGEGGAGNCPVPCKPFSSTLGLRPLDVSSTSPVVTTKNVCPWGVPGKNTGVGCHALPQEILLTPTEPVSPALQVDSLLLSHQESPSLHYISTYVYICTCCILKIKLGPYSACCFIICFSLNNRKRYFPIVLISKCSPRR